MKLFDFDTTKKEQNINPAVAECDRQLAELARKRNEVVTSIGNKFVELNLDSGAVGTPYEQFITELKQLIENRELLEKRKLAVQGLRRCEKCGNILVLDSVFCNKCGDKLEPIVMAAPGENACPVCGAPHEPGVAFCVSCGNKLK